jgi:hypothetical protein
MQRKWNLIGNANQFRVGIILNPAHRFPRCLQPSVLQSIHLEQRVAQSKEEQVRFSRQQIYHALRLARVRRNELPAVLLVRTIEPAPLP